MTDRELDKARQNDQRRHLLYAEQERLYRSRNSEAIMARYRAWLADPKTHERQKANARAYYYANRDRLAIGRKAWAKANADKRRRNETRRRAQKLGVDRVPYIEVTIFERDGWICQLCRKRINRRLKWPAPLSASIDHIIPLSVGGADAPANVQAAHLRCNVSKNNKAANDQLRLV